MKNIEIAKNKFKFLDYVPIGLCLLRQDFCVLFWNICLENWTKITKKEIVGTNILDRFPKLNLSKYQAQLKNVFENGYPAIFSPQLHESIISSPLENARHPIYQIVVTSLPAFEGEGFYGLMSLQDVTDLTHIIQDYQKEFKKRQRIEQALFEEKELAQVTLKSIGDAVITTDSEGKIKYLNPIAQQITGWKYEEAFGLPLAEVFQIVHEFTREVVENPIETVLQHNRIVGLADYTLLIARDGTEYSIIDSAAPIHDRQGKLIGTVLVFHDITESRTLSRQLSWQAIHDSLTGLFNRREFELRLREAIVTAKKTETENALCYLDLDQFKVVNDTCGHFAGDELLIQLSAILKQKIRSSDILARLGGDEFGLILYNCPLEQAEKIANNLLQIIRDFRFTWENKTFNIGVSIGLIEINIDTQDLKSLLSAADAACYAAKNKGRNCVHIYRINDKELARQRSERRWTVRINRALEENRFRLYCQKIIPLAQNSEPFHYEILLRLIDEKGSLVPPMAFIPAAERYDLMPAVDRWVIKTFLANYSNYCLKQSQEKIRCESIYAINISGATINNGHFLRFIQDRLAQYQIAPETICFEITETTAIADLNKAAQFINSLKQLGFRFALDDFGSGMSSLAYLKNLPVDYLKIDRSFVNNLNNDPVNRAIIDSFNRIAHVMAIETIAEGVENELTLEELRNLGVDYAQGYGIGKPHPLSFAETQKWSRFKGERV
ncbi:MAG: EAL domain-containing protein [Prochloraceae cyanobacterium]|nr:EAL domain-containing protein [Prochloraceae cyanobacterium]